MKLLEDKTYSLVGARIERVMHKRLADHGATVAFTYSFERRSSFELEKNYKCKCYAYRK
jgi:hypothetical protein